MEGSSLRLLWYIYIYISCGITKKNENTKRMNECVGGIPRFSVLQNSLKINEHTR